jgi:NAD(P)-dependent dehydrogenase (short-subunit alcohol dehydrogenase family)
MSSKVWFITGASRGIGAKVVAAVIEHGDRVVATARHEQDIIDQFGKHDSLLATRLDVTNEQEAATAAQAAIERFGRIDVLVNNAGYGLVGAVEEASSDEIRRIYETNVFGLLNVTRAVLPSMRQQHSGHVINISSVGGYRASIGYAIYGSTKFAVEAITEALHYELASLGIQATAVEPGYFRTDFLDSSSVVEAKKRIADYDETAGKTRERARAVNHRQPGDPEKLARALIKIVESNNAPLRIQFGSDAIQAVENKNAFVQQELNTWRELSTSTDF